MQNPASEQIPIKPQFDSKTLFATTCMVQLGGISGTGWAKVSHSKRKNDKNVLFWSSGMFAFEDWRICCIA